MPNLVAVVGLPGAGKTTFLGRLRLERAIDLAWPDALEDGAMAWLPELVARLRDGVRVGVDGQSLRLADRRARLEAAAGPADWHFFAGDTAGCLANILHDGVHRDPDGRHGDARLACLWAHRGSYGVPAGRTPIPVQARPIDAATVAAFFAKFPAVARLRDPVAARLGLDAGRPRWSPTCPA